MMDWRLCAVFALLSLDIVTCSNPAGSKHCFVYELLGAKLDATKETMSKLLIKKIKEDAKKGSPNKQRLLVAKQVLADPKALEYCENHDGEFNANEYEEYKKHGSFHPGFGFDHGDPFADFFDFFEMGGHPRRRQQQKEQAEAAKKKKMENVLIDVILTQKQMRSGVKNHKIKVKIPTIIEDKSVIIRHNCRMETTQTRQGRAVFISQRQVCDHGHPRHEIIDKKEVGISIPKNCAEGHKIVVESKDKSVHGDLIFTVKSNVKGKYEDI